MIYAWKAIRQQRARGSVAVQATPYSPIWWDEDRSKPSIHRQMARKWQPTLCVFHGVEGPREFVIFGGQEGVSRALDEILGPIGTKKAA